MSSPHAVALPRLRPDGRGRPTMSQQAGVRFGVAHAALAGAVVVAGLLHLPAGPTVGLLGLTVLVCGAGLHAGWTTTLGISAWALFTGFLEHSEGVLTFAGRDLQHLALLIGVGLLTGVAVRRR